MHENLRLAPMFLKQWGSVTTLVLLIAVILGSPLADLHPRIGALLALLILIAILIGASLAGNKRTVVLIAVPLTGLWIVARLLEEFGDGTHPYNHLAHVVGFLLSCTVLWAISHRLRNTGQVTGGVLAEALVSYLLISIGFSQLYWILNETVAKAFNQAILPSDGTTFLYFSMITLSGVGYGEILPLHPIVRMFAAFESMTGIFFIAVVVAQLVSSYHSAEQHR